MICICISLDSAALKLPGRDHINVGLGLTSVAGLAGFCVTGDPTLAMLSLGAGVVSSGALGLHMTASIGGADMPVVITLLNSYSGWALCAEGITQRPRIYKAFPNYNFSVFEYDAVNLLFIYQVSS